MIDILAAFDKRFTRTDKSPENRGYMENWFIKDDVTAKEIKQFIVDVLAAERERSIKIIEEFKTDKSKVSVFGRGMDSWEARTYDEKMLVNAILQEVVRRIKSPTRYR